MPQLFLQFVFIQDILSPDLHCFSKAQDGHLASVSLQSINTAKRKILFTVNAFSETLSKEYLFCDELILAGKLQLKKLQKKKPEKNSSFDGA